MPFLVGAFVQTCPKCGRLSRRQVLSKKLLDKSAIDTARRVWVRNRLWSYEENSVITVETFQYTRKCRMCGNEWTEIKTRQRPW